MRSTVAKSVKMSTGVPTAPPQAHLDSLDDLEKSTETCSGYEPANH